MTDILNDVYESVGENGKEVSAEFDGRAYEVIHFEDAGFSGVVGWVLNRDYQHETGTKGDLILALTGDGKLEMRLFSK